MLPIRGPRSQQIGQLDPRNYTVAWIAPLEIEARAALHLLDERHRGGFPVSRGDDYVFHAGKMEGHNIIIATLPAGQEYGTGSASALASQVKKFFPNLWFGLLVGVAAGLPDLSQSPPRDIRLGDVLVGLADGESAGLIAYDLGTETEQGFQPLRHGYALASTEPIVRSAIGTIKIEAPNDAQLFLPYYDAIRDKEHAAGTFVDPGQEHDILYLAHADGTEELAKRIQRPTTHRTRVWYGPIGSGDKLLRNAQRRNELRDKYGIIGVEMEAAGTMNRIPVGVIRGVCDYGDMHKNKDWHPYAAAMAAAYAKTVLSQILPAHNAILEPTQKIPQAFGSATAGGEMEVLRVSQPDGTVHKSSYYIQLSKNTRFTGRTAILDDLEESFFTQKQCSKMALVGLGGVGKTQIALHFAYQVKERRPEYSIFWVPVLSDESVEQAYAEIAKRVGVQKTSDEDDIKELVCRHLSSENAGKWLLVVDNADDQDLVFGSADQLGIDEYLPESENGMILLTTRSRQVAEGFAQADIIDIEQMDSEEATRFLKQSLSRNQVLQQKVFEDEAIMPDLLNHLNYLPLAIAQAAAYLNQTKMPIRKYLGLLRGAEKDAAKVLGREFKDGTRYRTSRNAIAMTWLVSFDQIQKFDQTAVDLLSFISCIEPKGIPQSMLPGPDESEDLEWAIGILCGYSFLVRRGDSDTFDMHSLVHMATREWVEKQGRQEQVINDTIGHLTAIFPSSDRLNQNLWQEYLPHTLRVLNISNGYATEERADLYMDVGFCLDKDRRFKEAIQCFQEAYQWRVEYLTEEDDSRLTSEHALACAYLDDRRIEKAIDILEHVVTVRKEILDEKDHSRLTSEHELARAYLNDRRIKEAIEMLEHVVAVEKETLDEKDSSRLNSEHELARAYLNDRRTQEAIQMFEHVVAVQKETLDEKDHSRLNSEHELARAYLNDRRTKEAIEMFEHVVAVQKETLDEKDYSRLNSEHELARAYLNDRRTQEAIEMFEHVVAVQKETLDETDYSRLNSEHALASAYLNDRRTTEAIEMFEHVVAVEKETLDEKDHSRLASEHELARAYLKDNQTQKAIYLLDHIVMIESRLLDEDDPDRFISVDLLTEAHGQLEAERDTTESGSSDSVQDG